MGKLIPFYIPVPKAALTLASKVEFDTQLAEEQAENSAAASTILKQCLEHADTIDQVLVMTMDKDGVMAFVSNCDGLAESILFMELVKAQALFSRVEGSGGAA
jgi:hypothetical protein